MATVVRVPDSPITLRESFALHLSAHGAETTTRIYLAALDAGPGRAIDPFGVGERMNIKVRGVAVQYEDA